MQTIDWHVISRWSEPDLSRLDPALANMAVAQGLPGAESIDIDGFRRLLDRWAGRVQYETERLAYVFQRHPERYENSEARFRMTVLLTVLQREVGLHYDPRSSDLSDYHFFSQPNLLFVHGVLQSGSGTCSSLPPTFAAVGRRLGYPLKLVTVWRHVFLRWEGPTGERFNVECTSAGLVTHPDIYYRYWPRKLSDDEMLHFGALQSLTPKQELSLYIGNRAHVLLERYRLPEAVNAYAHATELYPDNWARSAELANAMERWDDRLRARIMPGFPPMTITFPPRQFPNVPLDLEREIYHMATKEQLLFDPALEEKWWKPLRRSPGNPPRDLPVHIIVRYPQNANETKRIFFASQHPPGYDPRNAQRA